MAETYKSKYGFDWPIEMNDELIGLTIGKKWREYAKIGVEFKDPWVPYLDALISLFGSDFKVHPWAEEHIHDWVMENMLVTWGCASCGKSNDLGGLCSVTDWIIDPYDTTILIGSTTKDALRIRSWESVERYFGLLKSNAKFSVPGKITQTGYAILNDRDQDDNPLAKGAKAGIHGVALNDGGKLQGAHSKYVRLIIDELATINNHEDIKTTIDNLQIAQDFKFVALANPASWTDPSSQYCIPEGGVNSVTVDTGCWRSTFGCFVRHNDGMKSPCVQHPELADLFPFLTQQKHIDASLKRADGNPNSPQFWKMIRGFPVGAGAAAPVILDEAVAFQQGVTEPASMEEGSILGTAAGIDPAWTEGGDGACYARCFVRLDRFGRPFLDFTGGLTRLKIDATIINRKPAVQQLREQVIDIMRLPYAATFYMTAIDASANQGLADDLLIYCGANTIHVNNAVRASDVPLRANDARPANTIVYDRGTESWCVLAEFCRAGMVRGLPPEALRGLTTRRYMLKKGAEDPVQPLRLEKKEDFKLRFKHSPDETDACALAALAVKERFGLFPFGFIQAPAASAMVSTAPAMPKINIPQIESYTAHGVDSDDSYSPWS